MQPWKSLASYNSALSWVWHGVLVLVLIIKYNSQIHEEKNSLCIYKHSCSSHCLFFLSSVTIFSLSFFLLSSICLKNSLQPIFKGHSASDRYFYFLLPENVFIYLSIVLVDIEFIVVRFFSAEFEKHCPTSFWPPWFQMRKSQSSEFPYINTLSLLI